MSGNERRRRRRKTERETGKTDSNGANGASAAGDFEFDLPADVCRTNRPFPIVEVEDREVRIKLLPGALAEAWLAEHAAPADNVEDERATLWARLQKARGAARECPLDEREKMDQLDDLVRELEGKVEDCKRRRMAMVRRAVAAYCPELEAVADQLTVYQLYDVFIRLVRTSDPGIVGGQLRVAHTLGTSNVREAFQLLHAKTRNS